MPDPVDPAEIFAQLENAFGGLFGDRARGPRTRDVQRMFPITLAEAADGGRREMTAKRFVSCKECGGLGAPAGATFSNCTDCDGGTTTEQKAMFKISSTCAGCRGLGGTWDEACEVCKGERGEIEDRPLTIQIPGGATDGQTLRLQGMGNDLRDSHGYGNLLLRIAVGPSTVWKREGDDLSGILGVTCDQARDGGIVDVVRFAQTCSFAVPSGALTGDELRLRGFGALKLGAPNVPLPTDEAPYRSVDAAEHRGDLVVTVLIEGESLPEAESEEEDDDFFNPGLIGAMVFTGVAILAAMIYGTMFLH